MSRGKTPSGNVPCGINFFMMGDWPMLLYLVPVKCYELFVGMLNIRSGKLKHLNTCLIASRISKCFKNFTTHPRTLFRGKHISESKQLPHYTRHSSHKHGSYWWCSLLPIQNLSSDTRFRGGYLLLPLPHMLRLPFHKYWGIKRLMSFLPGEKISRKIGIRTTEHETLCVAKDKEMWKYSRSHIEK